MSEEKLVLKKSEWQGWDKEYFERSVLVHKDGRKCCLGVDLVHRHGFNENELVELCSPGDVVDEEGVDIAPYFEQEINMRTDERLSEELRMWWEKAYDTLYSTDPNQRFSTVAMNINDSPSLTLEEKVDFLTNLYSVAVGIEVEYVDDTKDN